MKRLLLVDGNSIINRAFFAVMGRAPMTAPDGTPTGAVNGFFNTILSVADEYNPTHTCVLFDLKAPTFRHKLSADYKATRKGMAPELAQQMPITKQILDLMGISRMELAGYEADDLIGTLSRMGEENDYEVFILSGDHDDFQLISDKVSVILPQSGKDKPPRVLFDKNHFIETYGVDPNVFVYVKCLMGDNSDNIKGIDKVGEKTAFKLISDYKDIDGVLANADKLTPSLKSKLMADGVREHMDLNLKLCTIDRFVPIENTVDDMTMPAIGAFLDPQGLYDKLSLLSLKMLIKKLKLDGMKMSAGSFVPANSGEESEEDKLISEAFNSFKEISSKLAIEEASEEGYKAISEMSMPGISFIERSGESLAIVGTKGSNKIYLVPSDKLPEIINPTSMPISFEYKDKSKVLNKPLNVDSIFDTAIAAYVLNFIEGNKPDFVRFIESLFKIPYPLDTEDSKPKQLDLNDLLFEDNDQQWEKKLNDASNKLYLNIEAAHLIDKLTEGKKTNSLLKDIEFPLVVTLDIIERNGMYVSGSMLQDLHNEFTGRIKEIETQIYDETGFEFNISSPKQLSNILFEELKLPHGKKGKTGSYSTSIEELNKIKSLHPAVAKIIDYRGLTKLDSTYAVGLQDKIEDDSRVRTTFTQAMTNTGRLSSTEPNLQNIPIRSSDGGRIRECFTTPEGRVLVDADYSQIELRLLAAMSGDEVMCEAFLNGDDIHKRTAMKVYGVSEDQVTSKMRSAAKTVNFSIVYGVSDYGLATDLGIGYQEASNLIKEYGNQFPGITGFLDSLKKIGEEKGYVETVYGRRRYLTELSSQNRNLRNFGLRAAMNTPIQGSAADIIKIAMNKVRRALALEVPDAKLVMQVHDELIVECKAEDADKVRELIKREMEAAASSKVPLLAEVNSGLNWLEAK